jgi:predicted lipoprotein
MSSSASGPSVVSQPAKRGALLAWPAWLAVLAVLVLLFVYPPFRVVSRTARPGVAATAGAFEAGTFAAKFWSEKLQPGAAGAVDVATLGQAMRRDYDSARKTHARGVGLGSAAYFFVRGSGRITAVERSRVLIDVDGTTLALRTGPVFGNALRDGSGLIDVNEVPGLAEFNALSAELNRLVETRVQPGLKAAVVGATVTFAGCAEAPESPPTDGPIFTVIPIRAEVSP